MPTYPFTTTDSDGYTYTYTQADDRDKVGRSTTRNQTLVFTLITTKPTLTAYQASNRFSDDNQIYLLTTQHPSCDFSYVDDIDTVMNMQSATTKRVFTITVTYTNNPDTSSTSSSPSGPGAGAIASQQQGVAPADRQQDPIQRTAPNLIVVKSRCSTIKVAQYADRNGKAFKNTLGDLLTPPLMRDAPTVIYTFSINRLLPIEEHYDFVGCVNDRAVTLPNRRRTWGVETLKLKDVDIEPNYENGIAYWVHNYTIESGPYWNYGFTQYLGWVQEVPNVGKRRKFQNKLKNNAIEVSPIIEYGGVVTDSRYLDKDGYQLGCDKFGDPAKNAIGERRDPAFNDDEIYWLRFFPDPLFRMQLLWA